jgi:hypothetical protein
MRDDIHFLTDEEYAAMQRRYGGGYVARRGVEVVASAKLFGDLIDQLANMNINRADVVIQYVDRADVIRAY